jgi:RNA polymerase sigma-70 factor (ECF subfamily)
MGRTEHEAGTGVMDEARLRRELEQHHVSAWGWALHCCGGNHDDAQDVLQTAYLQILGGAAKFKELSSFKTWLFAVVRRTARKQKLQIFRRLQKLASRPPASDSFVESREEQIDRAQLHQQILGLLGRLSQRQREVLHLVFYQELTIEEAASVMGVSVGSARTHYQRGKSRLRAHLKQAGINYGQATERI